MPISNGKVRAKRITPIARYRRHVTMPVISRRKNNKYEFADDKYNCITASPKKDGKPTYWRITVEGLELCKLFYHYNRDFYLIAQKMREKFQKTKPTELTVEAIWNAAAWVMPVMQKLTSADCGIDEKEIIDNRVIRSTSDLKRDTDMILRDAKREGWIYGERRDNSETKYIRDAIESLNEITLLTGGIGCGKSTLFTKYLFHRLAYIPRDKGTNLIRCSVKLFRSTRDQLKGGPWQILKNEFIRRAKRKGYGVGFSESNLPSMKISCMYESNDGKIYPVDIDITSAVIPNSITQTALHAKLKSEGYNFAWICEANEIPALQSIDGRAIISTISERARGSVNQDQVLGSTGVFMDFNPRIVREVCWQMCLESRTSENPFIDIDEKYRRILWCQFPANDAKDSVNNNRRLPPIPTRKDYPDTEEGEEKYQRNLDNAIYARDMNSNWCSEYWRSKIRGCVVGSEYWQNNVRGLPVEFSESDLSVYPHVDETLMLDEREKNFIYDHRRHGKIKINIDFGINTTINLMTDIYEKTANDFHLVVFKEYTIIGNYIYINGKKTNKIGTLAYLLELVKVDLFNYNIRIPKNIIREDKRDLLKRQTQLDEKGNALPRLILSPDHFYDICPDPAGNQRREVISYNREIRDSGLKNIRNTPPRINNRWSPLLAFLEAKKISITKECFFLKEGLVNKQFKWDKQKLRQTGKYGFEKNDFSHHVEALQYGCAVAKPMIEKRIGKKIGDSYTPETFFNFKLESKDKPVDAEATGFISPERARREKLLSQRPKTHKYKSYNHIRFSPRNIIKSSISATNRIIKT